MYFEMRTLTNLDTFKVNPFILGPFSPVKFWSKTDITIIGWKGYGGKQDCRSWCVV